MAAALEHMNTAEGSESLARQPAAEVGPPFLVALTEYALNWLPTCHVMTSPVITAAQYLPRQRMLSPRGYAEEPTLSLGPLAPKGLRDAEREETNPSWKQAF